MGLLFSINRRMEPTACLLFYLVIKMEVVNTFAKAISDIGRNSSNIQKTSKCFNKNTQKKSNIRFLDEYT